MQVATPEDVLAFWRTAGPDKWFNKDDAFDRSVRDGFLATYEAAVSGQLRHWESAPESALALVIVLDQFPRNMYRGDAQTFAADPLAREVAGRALAAGYDRRVPRDLQSFFYLPLMHSEDLADQERCVALYRTLGDENGLKYALIHEEIIRRFGRFPHRNRVLGRETTAEEQAFLDSGGFAG
jgi:uncharacterized protein (DUF924 family)